MNGAAMRIGIVFPGQGSQTTDMGWDLYRESDIARRHFETASEVLGYDLAQACRNRNGELDDTLVVQPALLVHGVACWEAVAPLLPEPPVALAGHSLGEISAAVVAGSLSLPAAVRLIRRRAELMASCPAGGMTVVFGLSHDEVARCCARASTAPDRQVVVANRNSPEQAVISGHLEAVAEAARLLEAAGGVTMRLNVSIAAHSPLMEPVTAAMAAAIAEAAPGDCRFPVHSAITGRAARTGPEVAAMLGRQLTGCVDWPAAMRALLAEGVDTVLELGPKTVLRDLIRADYDGVEAVSCGGVADLDVVRSLGLGAQARSDARFRESAEAFLCACLCLVIGTPALREASEPVFAASIRAQYDAIVAELDELRGNGAVQPAVLRRSAQRVDVILRAKGHPAEERARLVGEAVAAHELQDYVVGYAHAS